MKIKSVLIFSFFIFFYTNAFSQKRITWKELSTAYRNEMLSKGGDDKKTIFDLHPNTGKDEETIDLKDIEGEEITVRGYFLDLGADSMWFMLSRFPFENCFFCTGVGPETVIELGGFENNKSKFKTDDIVTVTGTLYLLKEEDEYFYILKNSSVKPTDF